MARGFYESGELTESAWRISSPVRLKERKFGGDPNANAHPSDGNPGRKEKKRRGGVELSLVPVELRRDFEGFHAGLAGGT